MRGKNISVGSYFDYSIPELPLYKQYKYSQYPNSYKCSKEVVNLPNHPALTEKELRYIVQSIIEYE